MTSKQALKQLKEFHCFGCKYRYDDKCNVNGECLIPVIEKDLDVLELIKTKKVNIYDEIYGNETYEEYMFCRMERPTNLTEKEWELLKGWLENEK